jgi:hypothetical protein
VDWIVIEGVKPWDGRYEFDLDESVDTLTLREWGWIKKLSGYLPTTWDEGLVGADAELIGTLAVIALCRHGKIDKREVPDVFERLVDSPYYTAVRLVLGKRTAEGDAGPPEPSSSGNGSSSGPGSPTSSETSPPIPTASGIPGSGSLTSGPPTSVK